MIEETMITAIADKKNKRNEIALLYANLITETRNDPMRDVSKINQAIIDRWSPAGLQYIMEKAWKIIEAA